MALFLIIATNVDGFTRNVETNLKIRATIDSLQTKEGIDALEKKIGQIEGVQKIDFSSKEEEINKLIEDSGSVFSRYRSNNPMPNVFIVEVKSAADIPIVTQKLEGLDGIDSAEYGGKSIENMINVFSMIRYGGAVFTLILGVLAIFLISNTIKMAIHSRNKEISIMRNVGASNWYIRMPFMFEGMFIGILGSILPILLIVFGYRFLYKFLGEHFISSMFILQKPMPFVLQVSSLLAGSGALVGVIGSFLAVSKYLRWKR